MKNQTIKDKTALFAEMQGGATVITPNNRLSNQLLYDFFQIQATDVIEKPRCMPYQTFLQLLFKQTCHLHATFNHPILLTKAQQRHLWCHVLEEAALATSEGLLNEVQEAWKRCQLWEVRTNHPDFSYNPQTKQFQTWQQQFKIKLDKLGAITEEQLVPYLLHFENSNYLKSMIQGPVIWTCFDDYTPQQRTLQHALETQGCNQYHYDLPVKPVSTYVYAANDRQDEWLQMIHWLKERLLSEDMRICVVVPDLQAQSKQLQRLLLRNIPPEQFNISLGESLADYPLVAHALNWLSLDSLTISNHQARLILHSPYLAGAKNEFIARAQLLQDSKSLQEAMISMPVFINECRRSAPSLVTLLSNLSNYPLESSPQGWISLFKTRLAQLGFPGDYSTSSATYQCFQRFMGLIDELMPLALISPVMNQSQALDCLRQLAQTTIFKLQQSTSPIQILGLLEASGCAFDSVWVCGLTDQCLPQKTTLSAFIPSELQRSLNMPHAVPERELLFAKQSLQRLQNGSKLSVFSYPCMIGDMPNLPSPLIRDLPHWVSNYVPVMVTTRLIRKSECYDMPLQNGESISGGTALLANQAKCPFKAFATHRLHAKSAPDVSAGPDLSERGQIMHKVMDKLWRQLTSQEILLNLSDSQLDHLIEDAILSTLSPLSQHRIYSFSPLVQSVELTRLKRLVHACLDWERQRPAFEVEALEQEFSIHLSGIDFRIRVDRLDRVGSNKWVIDYKSSLPDRKPWYDERPEEPQLLMYALLDESINALLFLQLKTGRLTCSGFSEDTLSLQGISPVKKNENWKDHQQGWSNKLSQLALEFSSGHCAPQPSRESTCQFCDFQSLCRIESN